MNHENVRYDSASRGPTDSCVRPTISPGHTARVAQIRGSGRLYGASHYIDRAGHAAAMEWEAESEDEEYVKPAPKRSKKSSPPPPHKRSATLPQAAKHRAPPAHVVRAACPSWGLVWPPR
jgi:hypothetical protein